MELDCGEAASEEAETKVGVNDGESGSATWKCGVISDGSGGDGPRGPPHKEQHDSERRHENTSEILRSS